MKWIKQWLRDEQINMQQKPDDHIWYSHLTKKKDKLLEILLTIKKLLFLTSVKTSQQKDKWTTTCCSYILKGLLFAKKA